MISAQSLMTFIEESDAKLSITFDVDRHDVNCGLKNAQTRTPCSCCKGASTFEEASLPSVKEMITGGRFVPNQKAR